MFFQDTLSKTKFYLNTILYYPLWFSCGIDLEYLPKERGWGIFSDGIIFSEGMLIFLVFTGREWMSVSCRFKDEHTLMESSSVIGDNLIFFFIFWSDKWRFTGSLKRSFRIWGQSRWLRIHLCRRLINKNGIGSRLNLSFNVIRSRLFPTRFVFNFFSCF